MGVARHKNPCLRGGDLSRRMPEFYRPELQRVGKRRRTPRRHRPLKFIVEAGESAGMGCEIRPFSMSPTCLVPKIGGLARKCGCSHLPKQRKS